LDRIWINLFKRKFGVRNEYNMSNRTTMIIDLIILTPTLSSMIYVMSTPFVNTVINEFQKASATISPNIENFMNMTEDQSSSS